MTDAICDVPEHLLNGPLSAADVSHFLRFGFVRLAGAFDAGPGSETARWIDESWARTGFDRDHPETWPVAVTRLKPTRSFTIREFAPRVHAALAQLMGGVENVRCPTIYWNPDREPNSEPIWSNESLTNYRMGDDRPWQPPGPGSPGWHVDGDWFTHFLDSPEQGLLLIVCFSDMVHQGGATFIAPDSLASVARFLRDHPEGVAPNGFPWAEIAAQCRDFREVIADAGDIFLLHPFMLHASSQNTIRRPRFMINPAISRALPMQFNRPDGKYDAMELTVLRALGVDRLDFQITGMRRQFSVARESK